MTSHKRYDAARELAKIRADESPQYFGLLAQAWFSHVLLRLGARVSAILNPGHPDIIAWLDGRRYNIEVEIARPTTRLEDADLSILLNREVGEYGFFCILDSGPPVAWVCVDTAALGDRVRGTLHLTLLRAYSEKAFSQDCTEAFSALVLQNARQLPRLKYPQLRQMALKGETL